MKGKEQKKALPEKVTRFKKNVFNYLLCQTLLLLFFTCVFPVLFYRSSLRAAYFYVKTNGNNTFSGSNWTAAWRTISFAASNIPPGNSFYVSNGNYFNRVRFNNITNINMISYPYMISRDNTAVQILGSGMGQNPVEIDNSRKITILGFTISGQSTGGGGNGIIIQNDSTSNFIFRNVVCSNGDRGIYIWGTSCSNNLIMSNRVFQQQGAGLRTGIEVSGDHNIIKGNYVCRHSGSLHYGIHVQTSRGNIVTGNTACSNNLDILVHGFYNLVCSNNVSGNTNGIMLYSGKSN
ncbi:MAG: hypothetical protein PHF84_08595, partial [bacterium]|nr:hypothetical protein [bacterium]